jgi:hypothetical protein
MNKLIFTVAAMSAFVLLPAAAKAPADATGECKDGTYTKSEGKEGACSSHGGVKKWLAPGKAAESVKTAERPGDATGQCKDGSYSTAASKSGACSGHKGVKAWYGAPVTEKAAEPKTTRTAAPAPRSTAGEMNQRRTEQAAGGGGGKVWVNTPTRIYHCEKDQWYGRTKSGEYMSESQAKAAGYRGSNGKSCT